MILNGSTACIEVSIVLQLQLSKEVRGEGRERISAAGRPGRRVVSRGTEFCSRLGVPRGIQLGTISNLDVAPTVAALLGIEMKHAKGHAIVQIVKPDARR